MCIPSGFELLPVKPTLEIAADGRGWERLAVDPLENLGNYALRLAGSHLPSRYFFEFVRQLLRILPIGFFRAALHSLPARQNEASEPILRMEFSSDRRHSDYYADDV